MLLSLQKSRKSLRYPSVFFEKDSSDCRQNRLQLWIYNRFCLQSEKHTIRCAFNQFRQRLNFPGSHPPSIFSAKELNYCVRYGNRCDLLAIVTEYISSISTSYILIFSFSTLNSSFSDLLKAALLKTVQKKFQSKIIS